MFLLTLCVLGQDTTDDYARWWEKTRNLEIQIINHPSVYLKGLRKATKIPSQSVQCPSECGTMMISSCQSLVAVAKYDLRICVLLRDSVLDCCQTKSDEEKCFRNWSNKQDASDFWMRSREHRLQNWETFTQFMQRSGPGSAWPSRVYTVHAALRAWQCLTLTCLHVKTRHVHVRLDKSDLKGNHRTTRNVHM
jgi:hypothetical protein